MEGSVVGLLRSAGIQDAALKYSPSEYFSSCRCMRCAHLGRPVGEYLLLRDKWWYRRDEAVKGRLSETLALLYHNISVSDVLVLSWKHSIKTSDWKVCVIYRDFSNCYRFYTQSFLYLFERRLFDVFSFLHTQQQRQRKDVAKIKCWNRLCSILPLACYTFLHKINILMRIPSIFK